MFLISRVFEFDYVIFNLIRKVLLFVVCCIENKWKFCDINLSKEISNDCKCL